MKKKKKLTPDQQYYNSLSQHTPAKYKEIIKAYKLMVGFSIPEIYVKILQYVGYKGLLDFQNDKTICQTYRWKVLVKKFIDEKIDMKELAPYLKIVRERKAGKIFEEKKKNKKEK